MENTSVRQQLARGMVIPACPLALNARRQWSERHQRALARYHIAAGAGGLAVGVHTTQFAIRDLKVGLYRPLLQLVAEELDHAEAERVALRIGEPVIRIGGICGTAPQAMEEAEMLRSLGWHAGLLSLGALDKANLEELLEHCARVASVIPIIGFYLQPAAGGRHLPYAFWRRFSEIENVIAIKIAPFNRYQTLDVVRAVVEAGRDDIALYTGNDDQIVLDLLTPFGWEVDGVRVERRIVGGLLGHWAVWTKRAVEMHAECRRLVEGNESVPARLLQQNVEVTDCNAAFFDAANGYRGSISGIHEVLRRQGLLEGTWCLDPNEGLSPGQSEEIDRVYRQYPHLTDDDFVAAHRDGWLSE